MISDYDRRPSGLLTRRRCLRSLLAAPAVILALREPLLAQAIPGTFQALPSSCSPAAISGGTGSNIGSLTGGGGLAAAFDGTNSKSSGSCANLQPGTGVATYIGKTYATAKRMTKVEIFSSTDLGFSANGAVSDTITVRYKNGAPANATDGTANNSSTFTDGNSQQHITIVPTDQVTTATSWFVELQTGGTNPDNFVAQVIFTGC